MNKLLFAFGYILLKILEFIFLLIDVIREFISPPKKKILDKCILCGTDIIYYSYNTEKTGLNMCSCQSSYVSDQSTKDLQCFMRKTIDNNTLYYSYKDDILIYYQMKDLFYKRNILIKCNKEKAKEYFTNPSKLEKLLLL